jgi:CHASE2 domain-containing sensor protein
VNTGDTITIVLRVVLAVVSAAGAVCVVGLFRRSRDPNPIPWMFFSTALAVYSAALVLFIIGAQLTIADWWRPVFSILNAFNIVGAIWVLRRSVNHAW